MRRFSWTTGVMIIVTCALIVASAAAGPTDPPFPLRIDFPTTQFDPVTGAAIAGTGWAPEGIAISGTTFYSPNTGTQEIIKGDLVTGTYQRNWVPASPPSPDPAHRSALGAQVDSQNRLWVAGNLGPAGAAGKGTLFVFDATTGTELAAYKITDAASKTMNDMVVTPTAVWVSDTTAPNGPGTEVQHKLTLGPGGSLPPGGEITAGGLPIPSVPAPVIDVPTPGFISSDGIDVLPNGNILFTSVSGNDGRMIVVDANTLKVTNVQVTTPFESRPSTLPPLLSGDGVALDGNILYYPENRTDVATCPAPNAALPCPGDWAVVRLIPPDYTTAEVVTRINSVPGSGVPPLRSPANMEQTATSVYGITRVVLPNPVTGLLNNTAPASNNTQTFIERLDKISLLAYGARLLPTKLQDYTGDIATVIDANGSLANLRATIDWGDGTPTTTGIITGGASKFTVSGTHNYLNEGTVNVKTTVTDVATGKTASAIGVATIALPVFAGPVPTPTPVAPPVAAGAAAVAVAAPVPVPAPVVVQTPVVVTPAVKPAVAKLVKLTIKITGAGSVGRAPSGSGFKSTPGSAGSVVSVSFASATDVKLTAKPTAKSVFGKWTGCKKVTGSVCQTGKLSGAKTLTLTFKKK